MRSIAMSCAAIVTISTVCGVPFSRAQSPSIVWERCLGGNQDDKATCVRQTSDGGYIVAGSSDSDKLMKNHGYYDYFIVKLTSTGSIEWQESYGGSGSDNATSVQQTLDGGYVIAGYSNSSNGDVTDSHGGADCWIVKVTSGGAIEWQKSLGGTGGDGAASIRQTSDGGYVVAGNSNSRDGDVTGNHGGTDAWIVKLTSSGTIEWQKSLGGSDFDDATSIEQTNDGGFIVAGTSNSNDGNVSGNHGGYDYWIIKLTSSGDLQWQKSLGGSGDDWARSIRQTSDGGYVVAGQSNSTNGDVRGNHGEDDYWIVKLSSDGVLEWQKSLGGRNNDVAYSIDETNDGGFIVAGGAISYDGDVKSNHGSNDDWIVKLTKSGAIEWQTSLGGGNDDVAEYIQQTQDGGFVIAGWSASDGGDVTGHHGSAAGGAADYWIVKLAPDNADVMRSSEQRSSLTGYPNPFSQSTRITAPLTKRLHVCNELGMEVAKLSESAHGEFVWSPDACIQAGMYFVLTDDRRNKSIPLILQR